MRTIKIEGFQIASGEKTDYLDLCRACLQARSPRGFSADEMRVRLDTLKEFPEVDRDTAIRPSEVRLSEQAYQELLRCVKEFRWGFADENIVKFVDSIVNAPVADPKES